MQPIVDMLRQYEDTVVIPMVQEAELEPIRKRDDFTFGPGTTAALVNGVGSRELQDDMISWTPLVVQYTDRYGNIGVVYRLDAAMSQRDGKIRIQRAEISSIMSLVRTFDGIEWRNPLTDRLYRHLRTRNSEDADNVLLNSWQLFRGGILPMLRNESYWFVPEPERQNFQVVMLHHLRKLYEGLLP